MQDIVWHQRTRQRRKASTLVIALSGWTDAGDAASIAANRLVSGLNLTPIAHLDPEEYYDFSIVRPQITIDERGISEIQWSTLIFTGPPQRTAGPVFVGIGPEPQFRWKTAAVQLVELARYLAVDRIITLGSLLAAAPHTRPPKVFGYSTAPELMEMLDLESPNYEGPTGFLSVVQSAASAAGIGVVSFWVEVPHYLNQFPAQRSAMALLNRVEIALSRDDDLAAALAGDLEEIDREVAEFVLRDPELVGYVTSLETSYEQELSVRTSINSIAAEVEQYLRKHRNS